jgi:hypothetical protein
MAHTLRSASWEAGTPASFEAYSEEHTHQIGGFSCAIFCRTTLALAVEWLPVPSLRKIADTLGNAVTFLRSTLRATTPTLFSFQGTRGIFSQRREKVEMHEKQGLKPETPNLCHLSGEACGELKPFSVKFLETSRCFFPFTIMRRSGLIVIKLILLCRVQAILAACLLAMV